MKPLDRRDFILRLALAAVGLASRPAGDASVVLDGLPQDIGRSYLTHAPSRAPLHRLRVELNQLKPEQLTSWLQGRIAQDFSAGRCFDHDGWWLSETEGQLCALSSI